MADGIKNVIVVPAADAALVPGQGTTRMQFFGADGAPVDVGTQPSPIPEPPASGTFVLTATDGVLSWEASA